MPEYPDIELYLQALGSRLQGTRLTSAIQRDPFILGSVEPPLQALVGRQLESLERMGKRIVLGFEGEVFMVVHLMISGRFSWTEPPKKPPASLLLLQFERGWLGIREAGSKRRARVVIEAGREALNRHDPGGLEVFAATAQEFARRLQLRRHTLKRALTDPRLFSGIGNAYSDEILLRARLSPVRWTTQLGPEEVERLYGCTREVLEEWKQRLLQQWGEAFPTQVTAFHPEMAAHGKFGQPCPQCQQPIQRIRFADSETNYCCQCQTGGKLLADRSLSRLLKGDWPRTLEELEQHQRLRKEPDTAPTTG